MTKLLRSSILRTSVEVSSKGLQDTRVSTEERDGESRSGSGRGVKRCCRGARGVTIMIGKGAGERGSRKQMISLRAVEEPVVCVALWIGAVSTSPVPQWASLA
jgi:hypothetical protein